MTINGRDHESRTILWIELQEKTAPKFLLHSRSWQEAGIVHYRLEFVHESGAVVMQVNEAFMEVVNGRILFYSLTSKLHQIAPQGTTEGSFFVPDDYLTLTVIS